MWTMDLWLIVYINAPYHERLCIVVSNQIVRVNRESKKNKVRAPICVYIYMNGEIIQTSMQM